MKFQSGFILIISIKQSKIDINEWRKWGKNVIIRSCLADLYNNVNEKVSLDHATWPHGPLIDVVFGQISTFLKDSTTCFWGLGGL